MGRYSLCLLQPSRILEKLIITVFTSVIMALTEVQIFRRVCLAFWKDFLLLSSWSEVGG